MNCLPTNSAIRRYTRRFIPATAIYVLAIVTASLVFNRYHPTGTAAYLLAILPALPILAMIVIIGMYLAEEKDEFQRNLLIQSMVWSMGGTLAVTTVWGFLEMYAHTIHLQPFLIFPLFWFFVGVSSAVLRLRYR